MKIKIAIIDSNISIKYVSKNNRIHFLTDCNLKNEQGTIHSHGTEVLKILDDRILNHDIYLYNLDSIDGEINQDKLLKALRSVHRLKPDILNLSLGVLIDYNDHIYAEVRSMLFDKIMIVSASENAGAISYPAYYEETLSISWSNEIVTLNDFRKSSDKNADVCGYYGMFDSLNYNGDVVKVSGSSFLSPLLVAKIINSDLLTDDFFYDKKNWINKHFPLIEKSSKYDNLNNTSLSKIKNAILFPVNKEIYSILNNNDLLNFNIVGVYDHFFSDKLGVLCSEVLYRETLKNIIIKSFNQIKWDENNFDTIIVGHLHKLTKMYEFDFVNEIVSLCNEHNKNYYFLDYKERKVKKSKYNNTPSSGAMFTFKTPSLAVVGTKSKIGKSDLQLQLYKYLVSKSYKTYLFMTEPYHELLGFKYGWTNGYGTIPMNSYDETKRINELLHKVDTLYNEIIIIGTQSQVMPESFRNLGFIPLGTQSVLQGSNPDAFILVVGENDSLSYIRRTIDYLESYYNSPVITLYSYDNKVVEYLEKNNFSASNDISEVARLVLSFFERKGG